LEAEATARAAAAKAAEGGVAPVTEVAETEAVVVQPGEAIEGEMEVGYLAVEARSIAAEPRFGT